MESPRSSLPHNIGIDEGRGRRGSSQGSNQRYQEEIDQEQYLSQHSGQYPPRPHSRMRRNGSQAEFEQAQMMLQQQQRRQKPQQSHDNVMNEHTGRKSQNTPLQSQYQTLINKRGEGISSMSQTRYVAPQATSNGFRISHEPIHNQQQFSTIQTKHRGSNENIGLTYMEGPNILNPVCHSCSVNMKSMAYNSQFSSNSILYSQNVPVVIQTLQSDGLSGVTQSTKYLRFELEIQQQQIQHHHQASMTNHQHMRGSSAGSRPSGEVPLGSRQSDILHLSISEDTNPLNLFIASIDIQNFLKLRTEQNIFVEFSHLPDKLQALLDFCIANREEEDQQNRFMCVMKHLPLDSEEEQATQPHALVDIFEHNEFRNLLHLRLDFKRATSEESSQWLSRKLLMQRKTNVDQQRENFELSEQHESDRLKINQIKQSLIALKQTQNEEMLRIKEDHETQLDMIEQSKDREIMEMKQQCENQVQELTQDFNERLDELKNELDQLRERLVLEEKDSKYLRDNISERETQIAALRAELEDSKENGEKLRSQLDKLKETSNQTEKRLLEQTMLKEQAIRENERLQDQCVNSNRENDRLEEQIQVLNQNNDNLKENLIVATEQIKQLDQETQRLSQTIEVLEGKVQKHKEKRKAGKREIRTLREEKLQLEIAKGNLEANIGDHQIRIHRLEKVRESQEQLIEKLEAKLKEDAQTLLSNKSLIEYLNKSLNEAQKFSFKTLVNQKGSGPSEVPRDFGVATNARVNAVRQSSISPLRASQASNLPPRYEQYRFQETIQAGASHLTSKQTTPYGPNNLHTPTHLNGNALLHGKTDSLVDILQKQAPVSSGVPQLNLPMTDFYLNKHGQTGGTGLAKLSFNHRPNTASYHAPSIMKGQIFNHGLNNPFSQQLERERIISEERLKQRFDEGYVSKYTGAANGISAGATLITPTLNYGHNHNYNPDISRSTIPQNLKHAIMEEQNQLDRRVSSSVFNPSGEDARASSSKNLNGARSAQDLLPPQVATSSVKRLVDIQLYAPPPVARGEIENYSQPADPSRTYHDAPDQEPLINDIQNASAESQRNAYEVDVGCEEDMEDEQNEYRRAGSRYSQPDNDEDEGEEEEQEDEMNE